MTDLEILKAAHQAAHRFADEVAAGKADVAEDADTEALTAFAVLFPAGDWQAIDIEQRTIFRYHFAVKLLALGLGAQ